MNPPSKLSNTRLAMMLLDRCALLDVRMGAWCDGASLLARGAGKEFVNTGESYLPSHRKCVPPNTAPLLCMPA